MFFVFVATHIHAAQFVMHFHHDSAQILKFLAISKNKWHLAYQFSPPKMGQNNSKQSNETALSPIQLKAKEIATTVRTTAPVPTLQDPLPAIPHDAQDATKREVLWNAILRAEGWSNLHRQVDKFLEDWTPHDLFVLIAEHNNEEESTTRERFALRYWRVEDPEEVDIWSWEGSWGFARMLRDELDLPGYRFGTALRRLAKNSRARRKTSAA